MILTQLNEFTKKTQLLTVFLFQVPVDPAGGVVLAPGIVVALLAAAEFIASHQHGHTLGKQQDDRHGADPASP